jgi:hypothetical protein
VLLIFVPFYAVTLIVSDPDAPIVQAFTYFPLTAPVTAMLRNGFGTLGPVESASVIAELCIVGILVLRLAVHLFRYGSIEYDRKLSIAGAPIGQGPGREIGRELRFDQRPEINDCPGGSDQQGGGDPNAGDLP